MNLPLKLTWDLAQTRWASQLNPVLANRLLGGQQLGPVDLVASVPKVINHSLGQLPIGWLLSDNTTDSVVFRVAWTSNSVTLQASANTTISLWVY